MSRALDLEQRAALLLTRREDADWTPDAQSELEAWLAESDAHKVAFWRLEAGWRAADRIAALGAAESVGARSFQASSGWGRAVAVAASILLVVSVLFLQAGGSLFERRGNPQAVRFATDVGGQKLVQLADGSKVELNTDTQLKAAVDGNSRAVWLDRGEAYFDVAKRSGEKFVIYAGQRTITVLGTKFSVRRTPREVIVAVLEGRVRVDDAPSRLPDRRALVSAGDIAIASDGNTLVSTSAEAVQNQLAWREGLLVFDKATLASAAEQFNRYNRRQLFVVDRDAAALLVEGSFRATNVDAFTRALAQAYGLTADSVAGGIRLSMPRLASRTLPKQIRPELLPPQIKSDASSDGDCRGGAGCAMIPLNAPTVTTASKTIERSDRRATIAARNLNVLQKLYPPRALAAGEEGLVGFTVNIDRTGNPTSCKITQSSGFPLLDLETCQLIMVHAVFKRPIDTTPSQQRAYAGMVNWEIPKASPATALTSAPPSVAAPKKVADVNPADEIICKSATRTGSAVAVERRCATRSEWLRASDEVKGQFEQPRR